MLPDYRGEEIPGNDIWETSRVDYLDATRRQATRLTFRNGLLYDANGKRFDTFKGASGSLRRAIFVMDEQGNLYASKYHEAGHFNHSSFLAGGPVAAAGEIVVRKGKVLLITDNSGHYKPARKYTRQLLAHLRRLGISIPPDKVIFSAPEPGVRMVID